MKNLETLRNLVNLTEEELEIIYQNINLNSKEIQLLDYIDSLNLSNEQIELLRNSIEKNCKEERQEQIEKYLKMVESSRTLDHNLSKLRVNPYTKFEENPKLFFGIGGGSKALCKGLPFDILLMILTGEEIRKKMNISECNILLANRITYTNIPKNSEFSKESIDQVMNTERLLLQNVLDKFGLSKHWHIIMQTELESYLGNEANLEYEHLIEEADKSLLVGGHHYSIEMADIYSLVGKDSGGVKLGWFMRNLDSVNGGYIMDEQPFHARYVLFMAKQNLENKVSLAYALAGSRIYPGPTGTLEKESPYICYYPENRVLLSPYEDIVEKMRVATNSGGGFNYKYTRDFFCGIIHLFEKYILNSDDDTYIKRIPTSSENDYKGRFIAEKMQYILNYLYDGSNTYKDIWDNGFSYKSEDYKVKCLK